MTLRRYNRLGAVGFAMKLVFMNLALILCIGVPSLIAQAAQPQAAPVPQSANEPPSGTPPQSQPSKPCTDQSNKSGKSTECKPRTPTKSKKDHPAGTLSQSPDPDAAPTKTVVRNGSTTDPIVAISPENASQTEQQTRDTNLLLASTDTNLKQIAGRQLTTEQQDTISQIKVYMEQARQAAKNGEAQRAYNLANKADMLATDLLRPNR